LRWQCGEQRQQQQYNNIINKTITIITIINHILWVLEERDLEAAVSRDVPVDDKNRSYTDETVFLKYRPQSPLMTYTTP
jgi:hypothetical protein